MSFRLLRQLSRIPIRNRFLADPFFNPTELHFYPYEIQYPQYRIKDVFQELDEMMNILAEPEMYYSKKGKAQEKLPLENNAKLEAKETEKQEVKENEKQVKEDKSAVEKKVNEAEESSLSFFGKGFEDPTFGRAQRIFEQSIKEESPALTMEENDELLKGDEEFKDILKFFEQQGMNFSGSSYQSSTIIKDGKAVTVSKHSKLGSDGTVKTQVVQEFRDNKGQKDSRKWVKEDKIKEQLENKTENKEETKAQPSTEAAQSA